VTSNPHFKVTILFNLKLLKKRYKAELHLQWRTNRESYYGLSNGAIISDLEQPITPVSTSRRSLTLKISETVRDTASFNGIY